MIQGIATDQFVKATALDELVQAGYSVTVLRDLTVGVAEDLDERDRGNGTGRGRHRLRRPDRTGRVTLIQVYVGVRTDADRKHPRHRSRLEILANIV